MPTKDELVASIRSYKSQLITNRTQADVDSLIALLKIPFSKMTSAQKTAIRSSQKGAYNPSDRNRVGNFVGTFHTLMHDYYGITVFNFQTLPTTWENITDPSTVQLKAYIDSLLAFRSKWYEVFHLSSPPSLSQIYDGITLTTANNIEKILNAVSGEFLDHMLPIEHRYCGEVVPGDGTNYIMPCGLTDAGGNSIWIGVNTA